MAIDYYKTNGSMAGVNCDCGAIYMVFKSSRGVRFGKGSDETDVIFVDADEHPSYLCACGSLLNFALLLVAN